MKVKLISIFTLLAIITILPAQEGIISTNVASFDEILLSPQA